MDDITRRGFLQTLMTGMAVLPFIGKISHSPTDIPIIDVTHSGTPPDMRQFLVRDGGVVTMKASGPVELHELLVIDRRGMVVAARGRFDRSQIIGTAVTPSVDGRCKVRI